jgi:hypothetical protein
MDSRSARATYAIIDRGWADLLVAGFIPEARIELSAAVTLSVGV